MWAALLVSIGATSTGSTADHIPSFFENRPETDATDLSCAETAVHGARISSLHAIQGATEGATTIADGGSDMYDGGNELRLQVGGVWTDPLKYTQVCHKGVGESVGRGDAVYNTCMLPTGTPFFIAAFSSESSAITGFRINGNLGADGGGTMASTSLPLTSVVSLPKYPPHPPPPSPSPAPPGWTCENTCQYSGDGDCDDGGPGTEFAVCAPCTDCKDCGPRDEHDCHYSPPSPPAPPPPSPLPPGGHWSPPPPGPPGSGTCINTCAFSSDGDCDDGGAGHEFNICTPCTDCADCGPRAHCDFTSPPLPSPPPPLPTPMRTVHGYYKQVYGAARDPSVNHLIIAPTGGVQTEVGTTTDSDLQTVEFDQGVPILYYVLWGGKLGRQYSEANFQAIVDAIATQCFERRFLIFAPSPPPYMPTQANCAAVRCGTGTCADVYYTPIQPPGCSCPAECFGHTGPPPPPPPPPPAPKTPAPAPKACMQPCDGGTCGNFLLGPSGTCASTAALGCDCTGCCRTPTDLTCAAKAWEGVGLPHRYAFTEGITGYSIRDGGSDMFDTANYLGVMLGHKYQYYLTYTQDCEGLFPTPLKGGADPDAAYATCKLTDGAPVARSVDGRVSDAGDVSAGTLFAAAFYSPKRKLDGFITWGNLGADGGGAFELLNLTGSTAGTGVYGYFKQVYGAGSDPSVNHLIITRAPPRDLNFFQHDHSTNSDYQSVHFKEGAEQELLLYLLWAGKDSDTGGTSSYRYEKRHVQAVLDAVGDACFSVLPPSTHAEPSPPPAAKTDSPDCQAQCGSGCPGPRCKTTCADFVYTPCEVLASGALPFTCGCGQCCGPSGLSPPPPSPPAPTSPPRPAYPVNAQCLKACAGSTCGAFQPMKCADMGSILGCDCGGCCHSELDATCVEQVWPGNLPGLHAFTSGILGYEIDDGGNDMYDKGNELRVRVNGHWSGALDYTQNCDGAAPRAVGAIGSGWGVQYGDTTYVTCKLPVHFPQTSDRAFGRVFVMIAHSKSGAIDGLSVMGNLGADEGGEQEANYGNDPLRGPKGVVGYYKKTYNADNGVHADPSVNHLVFGQGIEDADVTIGATTDSDLHELKFKKGTTLVYYLMFAGKEGYEYPRDNFEDLLTRLAASCYEADYTPNLGGGGSAGSTILTILLVLLGLGLVGGGGFYCYAYLYKTGKLSGMIPDGVPGMRSRTTPTSSTINLGGPPLQTPRAGLAANDSATFATEYTPPAQM